MRLPLSKKRKTYFAQNTMRSLYEMVAELLTPVVYKDDTMRAIRFFIESDRIGRVGDDIFVDGLCIIDLYEDGQRHIGTTDGFLRLPYGKSERNAIIKDIQSDWLKEKIKEQQHKPFNVFFYDKLMRLHVKKKFIFSIIRRFCNNPALIRPYDHHQRFDAKTLKQVKAYFEDRKNEEDIKSFINSFPDFLSLTEQKEVQEVFGDIFHDIESLTNLPDGKNEGYFRGADLKWLLYGRDRDKNYRLEFLKNYPLLTRFFKYNETLERYIDEAKPVTKELIHLSGLKPLTVKLLANNYNFILWKLYRGNLLNIIDRFSDALKKELFSNGHRLDTQQVHTLTKFLDSPAINYIDISRYLSIDEIEKVVPDNIRNITQDFFDDIIPIFTTRVLEPLMIHHFQSDDVMISGTEDYLKTVTKHIFFKDFHFGFKEMTHINKNIHDRLDVFLYAGSHDTDIINMENELNFTENEGPLHDLFEKIRKDKVRHILSLSKKIEWVPLINESYYHEPTSLYLVPLNSQADLLNESLFMNHCVGKTGYNIKSIENHCRIFSILNKDFERIATCEIVINKRTQTLIVNQIRGHSNDVPKGIHKIRRAIHGMIDGIKDSTLSHNFNKLHLGSIIRNNVPTKDTLRSRAHIDSYDIKAIDRAFEPWRGFLARRFRKMPVEDIKTLPSVQKALRKLYVNEDNFLRVKYYEKIDR